MSLKLIPVNGKIACAAPESVGVRVKVQGGFGRVEQKTALTSLKVVAGNERIWSAPSVWAPTGSTVYVSGEQLAAHAWAKQVYEHEGVKFIMVPESAIVLVDPDGYDSKVSSTGEAYSEEAAPAMAKDVPWIKEVP